MSSHLIPSLSLPRTLLISHPALLSTEGPWEREASGKPGREKVRLTLRVERPRAERGPHLTQAGGRARVRAQAPLDPKTSGRSEKQTAGDHAKGGTLDERRGGGEQFAVAHLFKPFSTEN